MRRCWFVLAGLAALAGSRVALAQQGAGDVNRMFPDLAGSAAPQEQRPEVDCNRDIQVTPAAGPWLILAHSYIGSDAPQLSRELVLYVRQNCKLPAYVFNRGREEREKQQQDIENQRRVNPGGRIRIVRIDEQYAVLIGGYRDMETARKALNDIRKLPAPPNKLCDSVGIAGPAGGSGNNKGNTVERAFISPFKTAFVVHNPTLPMEKEKEKPDPFLKDLNAGESYSLLHHCKKPWTLAVKDFTGAAVVQQQTSAPSTFLDKIGLGRSGDRLTASAMQAHELARVLRENLHLEAYVLHTRNRSVVSVGGFDSLQDPKMEQMQRQLAGFKLQAPPQMANPQAPQQSLLWQQPMPMEVPR